MKLKLLTFLLLLSSSFQLAAQEDEGAEVAVHMLANDKIADVNIDQTKFIESLKLVIDYCQKDLKDLPEKQQVGILIVVHKSGPVSYTCYSNPKLDQQLEDQILKDLKTFSIENTKLLDFPIFLAVNNTDGLKAFTDFVDPVEQKIIDYRDADLKTKVAMNKEYAINDVLPVLAAYEVIVDDQFAGLKNLGKLVNETDFNQTQDVAAILNANTNYWRAGLEMSAGNQLIPITKIFMLVSQGEFDYAKRYIEVIRMYSSPKNVTSAYLDELELRLNLFNSELEAEINKGIVLHDNGKYQEALDVYSNILADYPNSSWALYEQYFSKNFKDVAEKKTTLEDRTYWDIAKVEIYKHNPLYATDVRANNGREAYIIFRRQEIGGLFAKKENRTADLYKYAEIATDLGAYDFAAQLFWITAMYDSDKQEDALHHFLYCLDKMGETALKANFKGDFEKIFKKIDQQRESEMEKSPMYKMMKN